MGTSPVVLQEIPRRYKQLLISMLIIPAIDLKDGKVVRYTKGKSNKKIYSFDPLAVALSYEKKGARLLHLVDLDGAFTGKPKNFSWIRKIIESVTIPVEVGGGIRDFKTIKKMIEIGARRVILGTRAIEDVGFLKKAISRYGHKIALGIDASNSCLGLYGWRKSSPLQLKELLKCLENTALKTIIYTDITRDGTLKGINIKRSEAVLNSTNIDVIISGGISSLEDIRKLLKLNASNLIGVIIGKALYEGRFLLKDALEIVKG